ncbi:glycosyltransferase family 4 protein [Kitasatospora sp. NBC_00315]|uniref:glycosyltransferase family 4 protein n=1 Tax=Kitasatospora sp. NBC_00315 TaxID=2975963 RepID=UPI003245CF7D
MNTHPPAGARKRVVISIFDDVDNPHYAGGGAVVIEKVARRLSEEFDVTVVTAGSRGTRIRRGVRYHYLPIGWAGPRGGQLLFHAMLPLLARRMPHDLWMESFTPPFSTSFLPLFSRAPVVGIDQAACGEAMWRKYHIPFFLIEDVGFRCYRDLVVLNAAARAAAGRHGATAVHVIPNGIEAGPVDRARLGEGEHILFLGRIDTNLKGLDLLLEAYTRAAVPMPLLLAGAGTRSEERKLAALLRRAGPGVRWLGHVDGAEKQRLLARSAFMVMPSRHEAFGITALEAMAHGKPVLHFDLPSLRWLGGSGNVSVPPFDVDALADRMREVASDRQAREHLAGLAHEAVRRFSWDETTGRYLALARDLLRPAPTAEPDAATSEQGEASWVPTR